MSENNAKNRLGRGLAALIGDIDSEIKQDGNQLGQTGVRADLMVPIEHLRANPGNPRQEFDDAELENLANSIIGHGVIQPILVRPVKNDTFVNAKYEIIAGERRWRAAQKAGLHDVPILIRDVGDRYVLEIAIIENIQRTDLNPVEEAQGYQRLLDDHDYSQNDLARVVGKSRSHLANMLRLLKLPEEVLEMLKSGELSAGHARTLITSEAPVSSAKRIVREGLSVRQAEILVRDSVRSRTENTSLEKKNSEKSVDIIALENRLGEILGLKIHVLFRENGSGDIRICYKNLEQLDDVCRRLGYGKF